MTNVTAISIISTAESALKKLKKAGIGVYDCKKDGAQFIFSVKDKDVEKVFAIFDKACYNIKVKRKSRRKKFFRMLALRAGLVAGAVLFVVAALISDSYVLKIEVNGNGSYLEPEIRQIVSDEGAGEFCKFSSVNFNTATGRILSLPQVTFCNIERRGSVLVIDVRTDDEHTSSVKSGNLISDVDGKVRSIVAVCGTAGVVVGGEVKKGDVLLYVSMQAGEEIVECLAAGYAEIECNRSYEYFAAEESEENLKEAYAAAILEENDVLSRKHSIKPTEGGIIYVIEFSYLRRLKINIT